MHFSLCAPLIDVMTESVKERYTTFLEEQRNKFAWQSYAMFLPGGATDYPGRWTSGLG